MISEYFARGIRILTPGRQYLSLGVRHKPVELDQAREDPVVSFCGRPHLDVVAKKEVQMLQGVAKKGTRADQFEKPWSRTSREYPLQRDQRSSTEQKDITKVSEIVNTTDLTEGGQGSANW